MKKLFLSFLSLMCVFAIAQEKKMVEFTEGVHDFGTIVEGQGNGGKVTAVFKFTNISTSPLFIESARASCGCTTPQVDSSRPIAPGETGEIPVGYSTIGRPGTFNKQITITFKNAAGESYVEKLYIRGDVTPKDPIQQEIVEPNPIELKAQKEKEDILRKEKEAQYNKENKAKAQKGNKVNEPIKKPIKK